MVSGDRTDVVIVGGGIAGAALAGALAAAGRGVTVLEATTEFADRVRGESMHVWGAVEARALGVDAVLRDAGAHVAPVWKQYSEGIGVTAEIPMGILVEGIDGTVNLRHPDACQALLDAAAAHGAHVIRGVRDVGCERNGQTTVSYATDVADDASVSAPLVVGADGRQSSVRRQAGITLERQPAISWIAGLLVDGLEDVPDDHDVMALERDLFFLLFHQGNGRARSYICGDARDPRRFAGADATSKFLATWDIGCFPWAERVRTATPAGPCATYPGDDTWTPRPFADGVVLIGDAAGFNDPIVGQGLSIALRDARTVRDLVLDGACNAGDFEPYGTERMERMRRLRLIADVIAVTNVEHASNRAARREYVSSRMAAMDPEVFQLLLGGFAGPETIPDELVDEGLIDRIRAA
jgi:2-polyprenyl-6-methoxyphenol hydroxylase-like FAD-dependent oxidoreductase